MLLGMKITRDRKTKYISIDQEPVRPTVTQVPVEHTKFLTIEEGLCCPTTIEEEKKKMDKSQYELQAMVGLLL